MEKNDIFELILKGIKEKMAKHGLPNYRAFPRWFIEMYHESPRKISISDGSKDGKIDAFFQTDDQKSVIYHVVNSKFTSSYNKLAPPQFYEEISSLWNAFNDKQVRSTYLQNAVRPELRTDYKRIFDGYDNGFAEIMFLTNCRRNDNYYSQIANCKIKTFHLDDLIQHVIDDIDGAMPRTRDLILSGISTVLTPPKSDTEVATSIVFARLIDFIKYMEDDPHDLLFARNVRLDLGTTDPNKAIKSTFTRNPEEFSFSNNGITVLCEKHQHDPGDGELTLINPRVVNGSQTLHSIRDVSKPSVKARVMVRIIEIPPITGADLPAKIRKKKDIINKIAIRSNLQNPIKKWNLVANDDYQMELYRYFRRKGLYYERRQNEWKKRKLQLTGVGLKPGPKIKELMPMLAAYKWEYDKVFAAAVAKDINKLFSTKQDLPEKDSNGGVINIYERLTVIDAEIAYQLYLLYRRLQKESSALATRFGYIAQLHKHTGLVLLSVTVKIIQSLKMSLGGQDLAAFLEQHDQDNSAFTNYTKSAMRYIYERYNAEVPTSKRKKITYQNYFKTPSYVHKLMRKPIPITLKSQFRDSLIS